MAAPWSRHCTCSSLQRRPSIPEGFMLQRLPSLLKGSAATRVLMSSVTRPGGMPHLVMGADFVHFGQSDPTLFPVTETR